MIKVISVAEMQEVEKLADAGGHSYSEMMTWAGMNLSRIIQERYGNLAERKVLGLIGSGNNGGDTLVALADLQKRGWKARGILFRSRPDNDEVLTTALNQGVEVFSLEVEDSLQKMDTWIEGSSVLLDGVLGTGFRLPLKEPLGGYLHHVANLPNLPAVVAVDCPSGVDCDTGEAAVGCIRADLTVTMAAVKQGLLKFPAFHYAGEIKVVDIGIADDFPAMQNKKRFLVDQDLVNSVLPVRKLDTHKGTFGSGLIIAGSINYPGAAYLAAKSAYRIGCGLVQIGSTGLVQGCIAGNIPEATWLVLPQEMGVISDSAAEVVLSNLERTTALLVGPGLGQEEATQQFIKNLLGERMHLKKKGGIGFLKGSEDIHEEAVSLPPAIFDADGLNLISKIADWPKLIPPGSILTPHPGEMSRLTGMSVVDIQNERARTAERFAEEWDQIVVLKGAVTVIAAPDGRCGFIPVATPALSRAGTGDVLSGIILGLSAQGLKPFEAAWAGAWIHAQAGLAAGLAVGNSASVMAGDVCDQISGVINKIRSDN